MANCPDVEMVGRRAVQTANCPEGEVAHGELTHGKLSHGEMTNGELAVYDFFINLLMPI